ncbi:MAG TPA: endonuclease III [Fibrobacter sp.]|nr:endonuclease III [Fibrobacter sp.]
MPLTPNFIKKTLDFYFPNPEIPLDYSDVYTLLVAVLLSAQCTDARVNIVTPALFALADTPEAMAKLTPKKIEPLIQSCGLYRTKAKNIIALSKKIMSEFNGKVPNTFEGLESLPGVGHKTASVVLVHAFKTPAFPVDTHIHRLAARWGLSDGSNVVQTEKDLKKFFPEKEWEKRHLQMIYFGRTFCKARGHDIKECPICKKRQG